MSANIQMPEAAARKRNHDEYAEDSVVLPVDKDVPGTGLENGAVPSTTDTPMVAVEAPATHIPNVTVTEAASVSSPLSSARSCSPGALTDAVSSTPPQPSPSPSKATAVTQPSKPLVQTLPTRNVVFPAASSAKKKGKSAADKQREEQERAAKRQKKEEEAAEKEKIKAARAAEKAAEKEAKEAKAAERQAKAAEKAAEKAKIDREKEEKRLQKEREEEKKKRSQMTLFNFIKKPATADDGKAKAAAASTAESDSTGASAQPSTAAEQPKPEKTPYERMFQGFYRKEGVQVAPISLLSSEAQEAKSRILDEYISGQREAGATKPFDPVVTLQLIGRKPPRGIHHPSVKNMMANILEDPIDPATRTESQLARVAHIDSQLSKIPVKILSFYHDVRPPYVGTITSSSPSDLRRLSRRPNGRILQRLNYDYDSEAEWEEEEGEDLDDVDDEDEENEPDEEMADFLDDAEDVAVRPAYLPEVEPKSTGICFENCKRLGPSPSTYKFRMEVLLDTAPPHGINPFSTEYWQPKPAKPEATAAPVRASPFEKAVSATNAMAPPPAPATINPKDMVPASELDDFKRAVISEDISMLTKVALVDMLSKRFKSCTKAQVKNTLEIVAHRIPTANGKKSDKLWALLPEHELNE